MKDRVLGWIERALDEIIPPSIGGGWPPQPDPSTMPAVVVEDAVRLREAALRQRLADGKGACVVGIVATAGQAMQGLYGHANAVVTAGGQLKFLMPSRGTALQQMQGVDALLMPGGPDIHPSLYGEGWNGAHLGFGEDFDRFEMQCAQEAYTADKPMLGICRGSQMMNVAGGGTLIQDLVTQNVGMPGEPEIHHGWEVHPAYVVPGSVLHRLMGDAEIRVNSTHHQAVGQVSPRLFITAVAPDAVVEAVQSKTNPGQIGVQFHPESMLYADPRMRGLYQHLVQSGSQFRAARFMVKAAS